MQKEYLTKNAAETKGVAREFTRTLRGGEVVLLDGDLGSGKTTFVQGILEALGAEKPYTSPTFVIAKSYELASRDQKTEHGESEQEKSSPITHSPLSVIRTVHHIDTYRVESKDILDLGWEEILRDDRAVTLLEWPERVRDILPPHAKTIHFEHRGGTNRKITLP
jgi:tRNA threonylcarbamoyladenosine biosynthesis protein TsaE